MTNEEILKKLTEKWDSSDPESDDYYLYYKCLEAIKFRTPKKRLFDLVKRTPVYQCPTCRRRLKDNQSYRFCPKCGQEILFEEDEFYKPPQPQVVTTTWTFIPQSTSACENCLNNPKNGGSGNCNCTLGLQTTC